MNSAKRLRQIAALSIALSTFFVHTNQAADLDQLIKKYPTNTETTLNHLIADFNLDIKPIQELLPLLSPLFSTKLPLLDIPITITSTKKVGGGYQLTGTLSIGSLICTIALRVIQESPQKRSYVFVLRPKPKQSNTYSLSSFLEQFKSILPGFINSILNKIDEYIKITDPTIAFSTINAPIADSILGISGIQAGCSIITYIADGDCVMCKAKKESGLEKLGLSIRFNKKPTTFKDLTITPLFELDPGNGICLFKVFTAVVQKMLDDIGANNETLKDILDTLSFCLHSSMGFATDDKGNMIFYAEGKPKTPAPKSLELGKYGMIKGSIQDGFKFAGGLILGDNIALKPGGLRDKGFAAKFGANTIDLLNKELEFKNPIISATNSPQKTTIFDIEPICGKIVDPDPNKQKEQSEEIQKCRTKKITSLEKKFKKLEEQLKDLQDPDKQKIEDADSLDLDLDTDIDLDLEIEGFEEETTTQEPSSKQEIKTPEQIAQETEAKNKAAEEQKRKEIAEKKEEIQKAQEQISIFKNTPQFDFSQIRTIDSGIIFELDISSKSGSTLDAILRPLHLQQSKMQLVIPIKTCVTRNDIKLKLIPKDLSPLYLKNIIQLDSIIDALPPEVPFVKDLQQINFKPTTTEFDVNAKGQPTVIVKGTIAGSPLLGKIGFELYKQPDKTVIAFFAPTSPDFTSLFGNNLGSLLAPITQSFALNNTLITFVDFKNKNIPATQMVLFDTPYTIQNGLTIKTNAQITPKTPDILKEALESAGIKNLYLDIRSFTQTQNTQKTLSIEISPANQPSAKLVQALKEKIEGAATTCKLQTEKTNQLLTEEPAPEPIQLCPLAIISEVLSPLGVDQLLKSFDEKLCMGTKLFYINNGKQAVFTINGYSQEQQAQFTYQSVCQADGTECKKALGFAIKSLTMPGINITLNSPVITYSQTADAQLFRFDKQTLNPDLKLPGIRAPQGFTITAEKFCPLNIITSLGIDLGEITKELCVRPIITFTKNDNKNITLIKGETDDKKNQVELKITCVSESCTKTLGIRTDNFRVPFVDIPIKNPVITYTDATSDTIFDNSQTPLIVKKGMFVHADIPDSWSTIGPLKKYIQGIQIDLKNKTISISYNPAATLCLKDIISEIPDFLNLCVTPDKITYDAKDGLVITAKTSLFNSPANILIKAGTKTLLIITPKNFSFGNLPEPLNKVGELIDLTNARITYAATPTKLTSITPDGKTQEISVPTGLNLIGKVIFKGILKDIFGFISETMETSIPLTNIEEINLSTKVEKDLGILDLHSASIILHPKNLSVFDLALDTTIKGGDGINLKFKGTGSATGLNIAASLDCVGKECPRLDLKKAIELPIIISPIAAESLDCPGAKKENEKTICASAKDPVCTACLQQGVPLSFKIGIAGGIPKALGISGLFEINEQKFYVNSDFDATDIKKMGMIMQSNKVCLEQIILMLTQFVIKELGINFKIPDLLCFKNVNLNIAALPVTINKVQLMPGALMRGEFDFLGLQGTLGLCIRTPISTGQDIIEGADPGYDICKSGNKNVNFGVFAKGFIKPLTISIGKRPIVAITGSSKNPNSQGAGLELELSNDKQRMDINGRLVILPKSADINSPDSRTGILQNDMQLLLDIGSGILTGTSEIALGNTIMHTQVTINLPKPLESLIVARAENVGINSAIDIIEQVVGGNFKLPNIPTIGLKIVNLELRVGKSPSGFGAGIKAELDYWGQQIFLEGTVGENGLILKGRLSPVKFLASEDILYITDAQNPQEGPTIDVELTKNPIIRISGRAMLLKQLLPGMINSQITILTKTYPPATIKSNFDMSGNLLGFSTEFSMVQELTVKPGEAPSFDQWTITGKINDNLTDDIMRIFNKVFGPIKIAADISYKYSIGAIKSMDEECHKIPIIADVLCAPLDIAKPILETAGSVFKKIQDLAGPNMFHINSIMFSTDLTQLKNITDISKMELPSLKIDFTILGEKKNLDLKQVTLPTLPQKLGEQILAIVNPQKLLDELLDIGSKFGNMLADILKSVGEAISRLAEQVFKEVGKAAEAVFDAGKQAVETVAQFGEDAINAIGNEVAKIGKAIDQAIVQLDQAFKQISAELDHIAQEVTQTLQQVAQTISQALESALNQVKNIADAITEELGKLAKVFCFGIFC